MTIKSFLLILAAAIALNGCTAVRVVTHNPSTDAGQAAEGIYKLDPDHRSLVFSVNHLGFSKFVGRFDHFESTLSFKPQTPEQSTLDVKIDASSLTTSSASVTQAIKGPDMLNVSEHPEILFSLDRVELTGETTGRGFGQAVMNGRKHAIEFDIQFIGAGRNPLTRLHTIGFAAQGTLNRRDFGLNAWPIAIGNEVDFKIDVEYRLEESDQ